MGKAFIYRTSLSKLIRKKEKDTLKFTVISLLLCLSFAWKKNRSIELTHIHSHIYIYTNKFISKYLKKSEKKRNEHLLQHRSSQRRRYIAKVRMANIFFFILWCYIRISPSLNIYYFYLQFLLVQIHLYSQYMQHFQDICQ